MQLIGFYASPFVRRVGVVLHLLELDYTQLELSVWQQMEKISPISPLARVPILQLDDGRVINDSAVIIDYLQRHHDHQHQLLPKAGEALDQQLNLVGYALGLTDKLAQRYIETELREPGTQSPTMLARTIEQIDAMLDFFESQLATDPELATPGSLLWASLGCVLSFHVQVFGTKGKTLGPALLALLKNAKAHPTFVATNPWH